jgi:glycosyltransferase involved in cell wall biosynthesis
LGTDSAPAALLLAPETPYPLAGGGALRTASLLHYLAQNYQVDLIVFRQPGAPDPERDLPPGLVRHIEAIELPANRRNTAARAIRNAGRLARRVPPLIDRFAGFDDRVATALAGRRYSIGIIEHFWCAPYATRLSAVCDRTVLDLHNVESSLHERCGESENGPAALAHRIFRQASIGLERRWLPRFQHLLTTSESDARIVRSLSPSTPVSVYPNAIPATPLPPHGDENVIVFSGNMEYHPNRSAVRFFRKEVWPRVRSECPQLVWRLIGKNPDAVREFTGGDSRIDVQGPVEDAVRELARARAAVVPILAGSGTRLKILEAWAAGLPVVSTTLGAEGLPVRDGEDILLADGSELFAAGVLRLLACSSIRERLGKAGRLLLEKEFTWDRAWKSLPF